MKIDLSFSLKQTKLMKLFLNNILFVLVSVLYASTSYSLPTNRRGEQCHEKSNRQICVKRMNIKKYNLLKGNRIQIPVIPFKK